MRDFSQEFFTADRLARRWGMSVPWVRQEVANNRLAGVWLGGRLRVSREAVDDYEREHSTMYKPIRE